VGDDAVFFDNPDLPDTRSEMALPLRARGEIIGALDVQSQEPEAFSEEDVAVLQTLADQVAMAISNARLFQQAQESLEAERRAYGELSREAWGEMVRTRPGLGYRYEEGGVAPLAGHPTSQGERGRDGGEQRSEPVEELPELALPVRVRGQVIGTINAHKPGDTGEWTAEEAALMETLTEQLSVALESARLYQDTQRRAAREQLSGEVTARMRETLDMDTVLQTAAREMREALNLAEAEVRMGIGLPSGEARPPMTRLEIPIKVRDRVIGVIDVHRSDGEGEWTQEQVTLLETLADQLGQALEAAQLYQDAQQLAAREQLTAEVTARMRETLDVDTVLQTAARELREALNLAEAEVRMGTGLPSGEA
jgi:GAF domain-containing protein